MAHSGSRSTSISQQPRSSSLLTFDSSKLPSIPSQAILPELPRISPHLTNVIKKYHELEILGRRNEDIKEVAIIVRESWEVSVERQVETDVLYENQRGIFFFGIPKFSGSSLLRTFNLDPPVYQYTSTDVLFPSSFDREPLSPPTPFNPTLPLTQSPPPPPQPSKYQNYLPSSSENGIYYLSPTSATPLSAQPPNKAWEWKQKRWYVDMRGDVDEEGWEYRTSFKRFGGGNRQRNRRKGSQRGQSRWGNGIGGEGPRGGGWHGTHIWFSSFVRRRRWVRQRMIRHEEETQPQTIHDENFEMQRPPSPCPSCCLADRSLKDRIGRHPVTVFAHLLKAIHFAILDRQRLMALNSFLEHAGNVELKMLDGTISTLGSEWTFESEREKVSHVLKQSVEKGDDDRKRIMKRIHKEWEERWGPKWDTKVVGLPFFERNLDDITFLENLRERRLEESSQSLSSQQTSENTIVQQELTLVDQGFEGNVGILGREQGKGEKWEDARDELPNRGPISPPIETYKGSEGKK